MKFLIIFSVIILNICQIHSELLQFNLNRRENYQNSIQQAKKYTRILEESEQNQNDDNNNTFNDYKDLITFQLKNVLGIHYDIDVFLGAQKQQFRVLIDTGSDIMWVPDISCDDCLEMGITNKYNCKNSQTCEEDKSEINKYVVYGHGSVVGQLVTEDMYFSQEPKAPKIKMPLLLINEMEQLQQLSSDGILGLGMKEKNNLFNSEDELSFLEELQQQGIISQRVFSLYLSGKKCVQNSVLTIGGYEPSHINGGVSYLNIARENIWAISINETALVNGSNQITIKSIKSDIAVIDSGTTKITFPRKDLELIIKKIQQEYHVDCIIRQNFQGIEELICDSDISDTDYELVFQTDTTHFKLPFPDLIDQCYLSFRGIFGYVCRIHIQVVDIADQNIIILGEIFMQKYVTIFDEENQRIGFGAISDNFKSQIATEDFLMVSKNIYVVFFQVGMICVMAITVIVLANCYLKYMIKQEEKMIESQDNSQASATGPQGVTLDMSNGIESFNEEDISQQQEIVAGQEQTSNSSQDQSLGTENEGGRIKSTDR